MGSQRDIDDAIDRAVREIMNVEPRAGLRGRVLADLESVGTLRASVLRLAGTAAVLAAATVVFIWWSRPAPDTGREPAMARTESIGPAPREASAPRAAALTPGGATRSAEADARTRGSSPSAEVLRFPAPGAVAAANVSGELASGAELTGANVSSSAAMLDGPGITIQPIRIQPLTIDRIVIDPIPPPR